MISKEERDAINEKVQRGETPTPEEMQQLIEYATAEALRTVEEQGLELTCPHCMAPIPAGTLTCEYCGSHVYDDMS